MEHVWEDILTQQISNATLEDAVKKSPRKWVYLFSEGNADMRTLLGGKGAGVAEMTKAGLPVPPGFTITTEACIAYYEARKRFPQGMWEQVLAALKIVEQQTGHAAVKIRRTWGRSAGKTPGGNHGEPSET